MTRVNWARPGSLCSTLPAQGSAATSIDQSFPSGSSSVHDQTLSRNSPPNQQGDVPEMLAASSPHLIYPLVHVKEAEARSCCQANPRAQESRKPSQEGEFGTKAQLLSLVPGYRQPFLERPTPIGPFQ